GSGARERVTPARTTTDAGSGPEEPASPRSDAQETADAAPAPGRGEPAPGRDEHVVEQVEHVASGRAWDPVPVPPPTYTMKASAPRREPAPLTADAVASPTRPVAGEATGTRGEATASGTADD